MHLFPFVLGVAGGRTIDNVREVVMMIDPSTGKTVLLLGEIHDYAKPVTHTNVSFSGLIREMMSSKVDIPIDILLEEDSSSVRNTDLINLSSIDETNNVPIILSIRDAIHFIDDITTHPVSLESIDTDMSDSETKTDDIVCSELIINKIVRSIVQNPGKSAIRLHHIDIRQQMNIKDTELSGRIYSTECISDLVGMHISEKIKTIIRNVEDAIISIEVDNPFNLYNILLKKQVKKMNNEYQKGFIQKLTKFIHGDNILDRLKTLYKKYCLAYSLYNKVKTIVHPSYITSIISSLNIDLDDIITKLTDFYTIGRLLKHSSDPGYMKNIIVYMESSRITNIHQTLFYLGFQYITQYSSFGDVPIK